MDRFLKNVLDTDKEIQALRRFVEVAASGNNDILRKLPKMMETTCKLNFNDIVKTTYLWDLLGPEAQTTIHLCVLLVGRSWLIVLLWHQLN